MDNGHERATYDGHKLGHKVIREFYNRFSTDLGTVGVRRAWDEADAAAQRMLRGWYPNSDKIMVIDQYDHVKVTTAENDLNQFKSIIRPMAEQLLRAEQQQAQYQAVEGPLQAQYQAAVQQLQAECGARAQQLQAEWGARAQQLQAQRRDPRGEVERLKNQIKTYVDTHVFEDSQLKAIDRADMVAREREELARLAGPYRLALPMKHRQELDAMNFAFKLGMGRNTGRRGKSPKKSPRKTRKSSPHKTRKSR